MFGFWFLHVAIFFLHTHHFIYYNTDFIGVRDTFFWYICHKQELYDSFKHDYKTRKVLKILQL